MPDDNTLLVIALDAAVPLWIERLKTQPWATIEARRPDLTQIITEHGDHILYRGSKRGETARAFNALAEALALLSFVPGGVHAFGRHWQATHPDLRSS